MILPPVIAEAGALWFVGPRAGKLRGIPAEQTPKIAIDGGIAAAPDAALWIGDADSGVMPDNIPAIYKSSQDMTDLEYALDILRGGAWRMLYMSGFTGGRSDHFLGNIGVIDAEMRRRPAFEQAVVYGADGRPLLRHFAAGAQSFRHHGIFSVFTLGQVQVSISGACTYPVHRISLLPLAGRGISNNASGDVRIECDAPVIVVTPEEE